MLPDETVVALLDAHAPWQPLSLCPSLSAWQAQDELPLWEALEAAAGTQVPPPMFALCWPGSQALAHLVLEGRIDVNGRRIWDIGCGSGVAAVAVAMRGGECLALDIDPLALAATRELARRHGVTLRTSEEDVLEPAHPFANVEVVLGGDLFYSETGARRGQDAVTRWLAAGKKVWLADGGRPFFNRCGLPMAWEGRVPVAKVVEGVTERVVRVYGG